MLDGAERGSKDEMRGGTGGGNKDDAVSTACLLEGPRDIQPNKGAASPCTLCLCGDKSAVLSALGVRILASAQPNRGGASPSWAICFFAGALFVSSLWPLADEIPFWFLISLEKGRDALAGALPNNPRIRLFSCIIRSFSMSILRIDPSRRVRQLSSQ